MILCLLVSLAFVCVRFLACLVVFFGWLACVCGCSVACLRVCLCLCCFVCSFCCVVLLVLTCYLLLFGVLVLCCLDLFCVDLL